jgi:hypothetical protein
MPLITRLLCAVAALLVLAGCAPVSATSPPTSAGPGARDARPGGGSERPTARALRLLREWDARRADAWSTGDPRALRRLYAPGSRAAARDIRVLREYAERGLVVEGLTMQLLDARLVTETPSLVRIRVVDRVAGGAVHRAGRPHHTTALPTGTPVTRVVTLVRGVDGWADGWVVRAVRRRQ